MHFLPEKIQTKNYKARGKHTENCGMGYLIIEPAQKLNRGKTGEKREEAGRNNYGVRCGWRSGNFSLHDFNFRFAPALRQQKTLVCKALTFSPVSNKHRSIIEQGLASELAESARLTLLESF